jgi:hypothetical protein
MDDKAFVDILKDLLSTPNGQMRVWAFVLTSGAAYYIFDKGSTATEFAYMVFGSGVLLGIISMLFADRAKKFEAQNEIRKLDAEMREKKLDAGLDPSKDKTVYKIDE